MPIELRKCKCGTVATNEEELELFKKVKGAPYGRGTRCKRCHNKKSKQSKESIKRGSIKASYGVTLEYYEECMSTSDCCEICGKISDLAYDHNHDTDTFRGVLCRRCNSGLGMFKDSPDHVLKAYTYLKERGDYFNDRS